jgi:hypothetical protein
VSNSPLGHCVHCNFELPKPVEFCPECGQRQVRLARPHPLAKGTSLSDQFLVTETIADDGMSTTHVAEQASLGRRVLLRTLHDGLAVDPAMVKRFLATVRKVGRLHHPATIPVLAAGSSPDGTVWVATEDPGGQTLAERLAAGAPVARGWALAILRQVGELLEQAHDQGIVHGALDPARILIVEMGDNKDVVRVADLGVVSFIEEMARRADVKVKLSTAPAYLAPERIKQPPDTRSDVFALGVLARETLAAGGPVGGAAAAAIEAATAQQPGDRTPSPLKLVEALEGALSASGARAAKPVPAPAPTAPATAPAPAMAAAPAAAAPRYSEPPARAARAARPPDEDDLAMRAARPAPWLWMAGGVAAGAVLAVVITLLAVGSGDKGKDRDDGDARVVALGTSKSDRPGEEGAKGDEGAKGSDDGAKHGDGDKASATDAPGTDAPAAGDTAKADEGKGEPASAGASGAADEGAAKSALPAGPTPDEEKALAALRKAAASGSLAAAEDAAGRIAPASAIHAEADSLLGKAHVRALREAVAGDKTSEARAQLDWLDAHLAADSPLAAEVKKLAAKVETLEAKAVAKAAPASAAAPPPAAAPSGKAARTDKGSAKADHTTAKADKPARTDKPPKTDPTPPAAPAEKPTPAATLTPHEPLAPKGVPKPLPKPAGIPTVKPKPKLGG